MPFDIVTQGGTTYVVDDLGNVNATSQNVEKRMWVGMDAFYFISNNIDPYDEFPLLKRIFSDYYGDEGEIYVDQLVKLNQNLSNSKIDLN